MTLVSADEAVNKFNKILMQVSLGQEIVIIGPDGLAFQLVPMRDQEHFSQEKLNAQIKAWIHSSQLKSQPATLANTKPVFGSARGLIQIAPNFDDPIDGFEDYMP